MTVWIDYVKAYAKENNLKYKEALKQASGSYKTSKGKPKETAKKEVEPVIEIAESVVLPDKKKKKDKVIKATV